MTDRKLYLGPLTDNRRWDIIDIRRDDVFVVTPPKCGATWMQTIVALLFDGDAMPLAHILQHYKSAMALADRPNVFLFHYADMTRDLAGTFAKLAGLLGISHPASVMDQLVQAASFDNMKANAERYAPSGGKGFMKSDSEFFQSGTSGKCDGNLTDKELKQYDAMMDRELTPNDREWIEYGIQV